MSEEDREELLRRIEAGERIPFSERRPSVAAPDPLPPSPLAYEPDESDLPTLVKRPAEDRSSAES